jgi:hypothetical protein
VFGRHAASASADAVSMTNAEAVSAVLSSVRFIVNSFHWMPLRLHVIAREVMIILR